MSGEKDEKDKDEETPWEIPPYDPGEGDQLRKADMEEAKEENEEQDRD